MTDDDNVAPPNAGQRGDFFAVDRHAWAHVCNLGMNAAISYLTLAAGTGGDNRTTAWSVNAIEKYTNVSRPRARDALEVLQRSGCIRIKKTGTHPRYELVPAAEIPKCKDAQPAPAWIWLPNAIVTGAADETPPVELIRQSGNLPALRLFADLYSAQSLVADCGIDWRQLRRESDRIKVGEHGQYVIFGFDLGASIAFGDSSFIVPHLTGKSEKVTADGSTSVRDTGWSTFWAALAVLTGTGLVEIVEHLVEGTSPESEIIHPYGITGGEEQERDLAAAADRAGRAMLNEWRQELADKNPGQWLVPVLAHMATVQLVGIYRMRYRPRTKATAAWFVRRKDWVDWTRRYDELAHPAEGIAQSRGAAA